MSEKEVDEKIIQEKLNEIITHEGPFEEPSKIIKLFAKLIFNLRFDMDELKIELLKVFTDEECQEVNHKPEEEDGRFYT